MKKLLSLGFIAFSLLFFVPLMSVAQTTAKSLIGEWEFERVEILTGNATLSDTDKQIKIDAEHKLTTGLKEKNISFTSKKCQDNVFGWGDTKWDYSKNNQQLQFTRWVQDGKDKLKENKSFKATVENGKLYLEDWTMPKYRLFFTKK